MAMTWMRGFGCVLVAAVAPYLMSEEATFSMATSSINIRAALQMIAEVNHFNLVVSDQVAGEISVHLDHVPWPKALDAILSSQNLGYRTLGNVLLVAPNDLLLKQDAQRIKQQQNSQHLAPLVSRFFRLNYARASAMRDLLLKDAKHHHWLSARGAVYVDERTNTVLVKDTATKVNALGDMLASLDVPVQQVLIEARIVIASSHVGQELGIQWGGIGLSQNAGGRVIATASQDALSQGAHLAFDAQNGRAALHKIGAGATNVVNLGVANPSASRFALGFQSADLLLDMELSALESSGQGEVISSPKIITGDGQMASIKSGKEIPYLQSKSRESTEVVFKPALLQLDVTPHVTPNRRIELRLKVNQDSVGELTLSGPAINTNELQTQVLVDNGETLVLGGVFRTQRLDNVVKTPFLGDLPFIGALFRRTQQQENKSELLVFITPTLIDVSTQ